ncbi:serine hydrolase domain-containing protein [Phycicoccus duodecadis]|uniref:CubicO group peptidase (Beta-lactamase class C family) n=1 Tax=Phycicoccus duodecadis TaxID=173053 RepID=A0A2N3YFL0_9MICO|nr:serine hydrolase domain-containing protein [Phycicoccus duodecadis]PKW25609.1 CubicO group peptidase (beta-lactamase class C family) [Phycicoccus duodecadis]
MSPATPPSGPLLPPSTPEDQGVPSAALLALVRRWEDRGLEPHSVTVLRHGHTVAEGWWAPYHRDGVQLMYSVSKTFTACAVGFGVAEGLLRLDERVVDLFPESAHRAGPRAAALTLHDLLAMRTGHRVDTLTWREHSPAQFPDVFLATEPEEEPGWFVYNNGATLMAALAVQRRSGQRLLDYLRPRLLEPLGLDHAAWSAEDGVDLGYSGLHVPTAALARLGELVLRDGRWQGRRVLPAGWVATMTALHTDTSVHPGEVEWQQGYGYQMWRCRHGAVRADGAYGQVSVVVPEAELVVALTGCTERTQETLDAIWEELLPHLAGAPLPPAPAAHAALTEALAAASLPAPSGAPQPSGPTPADGPWSYAHTPTEEVPLLERVEVAPAAGGHGWTLRLTEGEDALEVPCGADGWPQTTTSGPWTASGGWSAPGVFEARVVAVQTPHVLHLRCADGVATTTWNGLPLNRPVLRRLRAPA